MEYPEFFLRFIGGCRRKHVATDPGARVLPDENPEPSSPSAIDPRKGSRYRIPDTSELPAGFICLDPWEAEYLFVLARDASHGMLETGRARGGSTFVLACANPRVPIHSIDVAPLADAALRSLFCTVGVGQNVEAIVGDSQSGEYPGIGALDLLFIDGDHSFAGCTADLEHWYPKVVPGGHVVLHDSFGGSEVQRAAIAFIDRHDVQLIQPPYMSASHWRNPAGSLAHFRKPCR
jgi:predicted O-methyltransferase YrrM